MRPTHHTFGPLANREQIRLALRLAFQPSRWKKGPEQTELEHELGKAFGAPTHLFGSGREALLAILRALKCRAGEEVIVQGYTCVVVPNAIIAAGMTPVFADIEEDTLNLDVAEVEKLITPQTRAIICQHTFGIPAFTKELRSLCDRHSLMLIEDCAHIIPDAAGPKEIGHLGDAMFFSFGRDKAISGVAGGAALSKHPEIADDLHKQKEEAASLHLWEIKRFLQYPILYMIAKRLYGIGLGKTFLYVCAKLRILARILTEKEKEGVMNATIHAMPNACAALALQQWKNLQLINDHRRMLTSFYFEESVKRSWPMLLGVLPDYPLQKFPLFTQGAERIRQTLKKENIYLHDGWTGCVICPESADAGACGYKDGDDPDAEMAGRQILSLPTHPDTSITQAKRLVEILDPLLRCQMSDVSGASRTDI